jgi:hypothetical protein
MEEATGQFHAKAALSPQRRALLYPLDKILGRDLESV